MKKKAAKVFQTALFVVIIVFILTAVFFMVMNRAKNNRPKFVFGKAILWVETGSMKPEIDERSYILVSSADKKDVKVGDVIVFVCKDKSLPVYNALVTHRVIEVTEAGYITKGDNNPAADSLAVAKDDIVAIYDKNLPVCTFFGRIFSSGVGLLIIVAFTLFACAFIYIPDLVKAVKDIKTENKEEEIDRRVKEEVKRLEREYNGKQLPETVSAKKEHEKQADPGEQTENGADKV